MFIEQIDKNVLTKLLQTVIGVVERKQPLPIFSYVLIESNGEELKLIATDSELQIEASNLLSSEPFSFTVSAKKFLDILRALPDDVPLSIKKEEEKLQIKSKKARFNLQTLPAQNFPKIPEQSNQVGRFEIGQSVLKNLLGMVQYAMAQQNVRYYLNGMLMIVEGNTLKLVATDGHRLAFVSAQLEQSYEKIEAIIPRKTISELVKLLSSDGENLVTLNFGEKNIRIACGSVTLKTKTIDGKFPDYQRVIPSYQDYLIINRNDMLAALQRVSILSNEKIPGVRFLLEDNKMHIASSNAEQEEAEEILDVEFSGAPLDISFNVNYLVDVLHSIPGGNVKLSFGGQNGSLLITIPENDDFKYVVMPMRL